MTAEVRCKADIMDHFYSTIGLGLGCILSPLHIFFLCKWFSGIFRRERWNFGDVNVRVLFYAEDIVIVL